MAWTDTDIIYAGGGEDHTTLTSWQNEHDSETPSGGECTAAIRGAVAAPNYWDGWSGGNMTAANRLVVTYETADDATDGTDGAGDDARITSGGNDLFFGNGGGYDVYMMFKGIEFNAVRGGLRNNGTSESHIKWINCYLTDYTTDSIRTANSAANSTVQIGGCLLVDNADSGDGSIRLGSANITAEVYNNTVYSGAYGIWDDGASVTARNNAVANTSVSDFNGTFNTSSNNASEDGSEGSPFTPSTEWLIPGSDFRLNATTTVLEAGGTSLPSWYTDETSVDMAGTTWDTTTPSIGCFETGQTAGGDVFITNRITEIEKGVGPITAAQLGGILIGG